MEEGRWSPSILVYYMFRKECIKREGEFRVMEEAGGGRGGGRGGGINYVILLNWWRREGSTRWQRSSSGWWRREG